jgi:hypothetical protein
VFIYVQPQPSSVPEDESFIEIVEDLMEKVQDAEKSKDDLVPIRIGNIEFKYSFCMFRST